MGRFLIARLAQAAAVVVVVATLTFFLIRLAPGEPFAYEDSRISATVRAQWRAQAGYDRPLPEQYARYLTNVTRGSLGYSIAERMPVTTALGIALPPTLLLASVSLVFALVLGITVGAAQAAFRGGWFDRLTSSLFGALYAIPDFALALLVLFIFARWPTLFATGMVDPAFHDYMSPLGKLFDTLHHLVLPALTLTLAATTVIARYQRAALLDVLSLDFVRTARAKGVSERAVIGRHALRNALASTIALVGLLLPALLGGVFFIEKVFSWPGMGLLILSAIDARDYDLVTGAVIVAAILVTLGNLAADLIHAAVDPRVRAH